MQFSEVEGQPVIPNGYYWLYTPNILRQLRREFDPEGYKRDEETVRGICEEAERKMASLAKNDDEKSLRQWLRAESDKVFSGKVLEIGDDLYAQNLPLLALDQVRKRTSLFRKDDQGWTKLVAHWSFFPGTAALVQSMRNSELAKIRQDVKEMEGEIESGQHSGKFRQMPFAELDGDFDFLGDMWGNPNNTRLERLNRGLVTDGSCDHHCGLYRDIPMVERPCPYEIHSVATSKQIEDFKALILSEYEKELKNRNPNKALVAAVKAF